MNKLTELFFKYDWIIIRFLIILIFTLWIFSYIPDLKISPDTLNKIGTNNDTSIDLRTGSFDLNQEDLTSLNFNVLFWKIIYLNHWRDEICFEKDNLSDSQEFWASYNGGEFYNITKKRCFDIPKNEENLTFDTKFIMQIIIPPMKKLSPVNKSDCIPETIDEISHTCLTKEGIKNAKSETLQIPEVSVYLEPNWFYRIIIKFFWVFILGGIFLWNVTRIIVLIRDGLKIPLPKKYLNTFIYLFL